MKTATFRLPPALMERFRWELKHNERMPGKEIITRVGDNWVEIVVEFSTRRAFDFAQGVIHGYFHPGMEELELTLSIVNVVLAALLREHGWVISSPCGANPDGKYEEQLARVEEAIDAVKKLHPVEVEV